MWEKTLPRERERKLFGQPKRAKVYDGWARGAKAPHRNVDQNELTEVSLAIGIADDASIQPSNVIDRMYKSWLRLKLTAF